MRPSSFILAFLPSFIHSFHDFINVRGPYHQWFWISIHNTTGIWVLIGHILYAIIQVGSCVQFIFRIRDNHSTILTIYQLGKNNFELDGPIDSYSNHQLVLKVPLNLI